METTWLYAMPLWLVFVLSLAVILGAGEVGRGIASARGPENGSNIFTLEAAVFGLLALLISFTFSMALGRFEERRSTVLLEANSIETTALRARLLPPPHAHESLDLLRAYTRLRTDLIGRRPTAAEFDANLARSNDIQEKLWQETKAVVALDPGMVPTGLFIQTLNEMIDDQEKRLTAARNRVPPVVFFGLYAITVVAMTFAGYATGHGRGTRVPMYVIGTLSAAVILLIMDLDHPMAGLISVNQQPMLDTAASLASMTE